METDINKMTVKEFQALPVRGWNDNVGTFTSLVILPTKRKHDSGYRCMDFVAVKDGKPIARLSGCSDVIHIDGIGGYGDWFERFGTTPDKVAPRSWSIDCLNRSGLLHLFCSYRTNGKHEGRKLKAGAALSSFEIDTVNAD